MLRPGRLAQRLPEMWAAADRPSDGTCSDGAGRGLLLRLLIDLFFFDPTIVIETPPSPSE